MYISAAVSAAYVIVIKGAILIRGTARAFGLIKNRRAVVRSYFERDVLYLEILEGGESEKRYENRSLR
jgi:hypothetical protein